MPIAATVSDVAGVRHGNTASLTTASFSDHCPLVTRDIGRDTRRSSSRSEDLAEHEIRLNWREFDAYVNRWANALAALGVAHGDRVATVLANSLELLATYWACAKLGAVAVPLSPLLTATGLASLLADAPPTVVVLASSDQLPMLDEVRRRASRRSPAWVLVDAAADDEAAGYRAYGLLHADASDAAPVAQRRGRATC